MWTHCEARGKDEEFPLKAVLLICQLCADKGVGGAGEEEELIQLLSTQSTRVVCRWVTMDKERCLSRMCAESRALRLSQGKTGSSRIWRNSVWRKRNREEEQRRDPQDQLKVSGTGVSLPVGSWCEDQCLWLWSRVRRGKVRTSLLLWSRRGTETSGLNLKGIMP